MYHMKKKGMLHSEIAPVKIKMGEKNQKRSGAEKQSCKEIDNDKKEKGACHVRMIVFSL